MLTRYQEFPDMAVLHYLPKSRVFAWEGTFEDRTLPKAAGFRWHGEKKQWWTDSPAKAARLSAYANEEAIEALNEAGVLNAIKDSRALDADIDIPTKPGNEYRGYQKAGVKFLVDSQRRAQMIGDEMGVGKTIQVLGYMNYARPRNTLIICPASLKRNWAREAEKWLVADHAIQVCDGRDARVDHPGGKPQVVIANYDILRGGILWSALMTCGDFDLVVIDEVHKLKNPDTQQTRSLLGYWDKSKSQMIEGLQNRGAKVVVLTGTPVPNRPIEIFPLLKTLAPDVAGKSKMKFGLRYCNAHRGAFGWDWNGSSNEDELQSLLRGSGFMIRRLKKDVLAELPEKTRVPVVVGAKGKAIKAALKAEREAMGGEMPDWRDIRSGGVKVAFEAMSKVRLMMGEAKTAFVLDYVKELLETEDKVIIMAHHRAVVDALQHELRNYGAVTVTGSTPANLRQARVDDFQNDPETRVFIGNILAAGVGLTLTAASHVVFAEMDWVPANNVQAEDRAHRIGQNEAVTIHYCVVEDSLDAHILDTWMGKETTIARIVDEETAAEEIEAGSLAKPVAPKPAAPARPKSDEGVLIDVDALHQALKLLSDACDGAVELDGRGFNGTDTNFGKSLASAPCLSERQAIVGYRMIRKYHRQLPHTLKVRLELVR